MSARNHANPWYRRRHPDLSESRCAELHGFVFALRLIPGWAPYDILVFLPTRVWLAMKPLS
jgi:hypothetical protein